MNYLISGDPLSPESTDLIAQTMNLPVGEPLPDGWRVLTGNEKTSLIGRLAYRYEIESTVTEWRAPDDTDVGEERSIRLDGKTFNGTVFNTTAQFPGIYVARIKDGPTVRVVTGFEVSK
jgi:hypothetical protein